MSQIVVTDAATSAFWSRVEKTEDGCWNWAGRLNGPGGYGTFLRHTYAHRYAYTLAHGAIPDGLSVDHICFNRRCVNPAHLRAVTTKQNLEHQSGPRAGSSSGVRGVTWHKRHNKWMAQTKHHGSYVFGGYFDTIEEAEAAIISIRSNLFTHDDAGRAA